VTTESTKSFDKTRSLIHSGIRNFIGRNRKSVQDLSFLLLLLLVGLYIAFEVDIFANQEGVTRHEQTIELDEALMLAGILVVGLLIFAARRYAEQKSEMRQRLEEAGKRADQETVHAAEVAAMHRRTIETLALAVEGKDQSTHDHLERVETYAVEIGKEMGFDDTGIAALRAAALLHDIGKLAVPEYIIAKPGKLTPEEFARMKTHTVVGAEIVDRMRFPFEVASLVRGHHEKWDGSGYPDGLAGEQIPIGARILAAVDCLDALASDRSYRRAMTLNAAIEVIRAESAKSFDPQVVEILGRRFVDLAEKMKSSVHIESLPLSEIVGRGVAPAAGFEMAVGALTTPVPEERGANAPRITGRAILEPLEGALREKVPWDAMALYLRCEEILTPVSEDIGDFRIMVSSDIAVGEGLSGWVAENCRAIVNGNPSVEPGYTDCGLHSALAIPLIAASGTVGVLSLYRREPDAFTKRDLDAATSLGSAFAGILESGLTGRCISPC
jgi:putative nucleotidyltransferase with HDIG domain